jgi:peptide/nickel transport system ATP-binding protein
MSVKPQASASAAPVAEKTQPLLRVEDLKVHFPIRRGVLQRQVGAVKAVDGISFEAAANRPLAA